jgi:hypothetical protein
MKTCFSVSTIAFYKMEPISKRLKNVTPAKADVQKRTENTG